MMETNFKISVEKGEPLTARKLMEFKPPEPYLGALSLTIIRTTPPKKNTSIKAKYDVYSPFEEKNFYVQELIRDMKAAGFFWQPSQIAVLHTENHYGGDEEILEVKLQAFEMTESDFTQKKIKNKPNAPYEMLANAIVLAAVDDYRTAKRVGGTGGQFTKDSIEAFFRSDYFSHITKLDGEVLIEKLRREPIKYDKAYKAK